MSKPHPAPDASPLGRPILRVNGVHKTYEMEVLHDHRRVVVIAGHDEHGDCQRGQLLCDPGVCTVILAGGQIARKDEQLAVRPLDLLQRPQKALSNIDSVDESGVGRDVDVGNLGDLHGSGHLRLWIHRCRRPARPDAAMNVLESSVAVP